MHNSITWCAFNGTHNVLCAVYDVLLTHIARLLECANELAQQFLTVLMRCGASEKKYIGRGSPAYGLFVLYTISLESECIRKNFRFCDAPSHTKAMTLKSAASSFCTASQASGNIISAVRLCVANWA